MERSVRYRMESVGQARSSRAAEFRPEVATLRCQQEGQNKTECHGQDNGGAGFHPQMPCQIESDHPAERPDDGCGNHHAVQPLGEKAGGRCRRDDGRGHQSHTHDLYADHNRHRQQHQQPQAQGFTRQMKSLCQRAVKRDEQQFLVKQADQQQYDPADDNDPRR